MKETVMPAIAVLLLLIGTLPASADVVELKTDQRVEGDFKEATAAVVVVEVGGQVITFQRDQVRAIYFGAAPAPFTQPSALQEALRALKALQSVTQGGVTYRDYGPRVNDAKIVVDRYLQEPEKSDAPERNMIKEALEIYVFALTAWSSKVADSPPSFVLARDPVVDRCPALKQKVVHLPITGDAWKDVERGVIIKFEIPTIWSCASDKIAEAERILKK